MGHIKKMLGAKQIEPRTLTATTIWTDLCEDIHLHYRNLRLDFSETEFAAFRAAINMLGRAVEVVSLENDYKEGDPNFLIQQIFNTPLKSDSDYYPNRLTLEVQKDNTVHLHYRDLRLHLTHNEFLDIAWMFHDALTEFQNDVGWKYHPEVATRLSVPIKDVQPYDEGHRPLAIDDEHKKGIEFIKEQIVQGAKIRPILVDTTGQRLDGFKRYMAFKELGYKHIDCIVDPFGRPGGQSHQSLYDDDEE